MGLHVFRKLANSSVPPNMLSWRRLGPALKESHSNHHSTSARNAHCSCRPKERQNLEAKSEGYVLEDTAAKKRLNVSAKRLNEDIADVVARPESPARCLLQEMLQTRKWCTRRIGGPQREQNEPTTTCSRSLNGVCWGGKGSRSIVAAMREPRLGTHRVGLKLLSMS